MMGFTEDLLNCVVSDIEQNWELSGKNLTYFVAKVKDSRLNPKTLNTYLAEHREKCHEGVTAVFSAIINQENKEGGEA